MNTETAKIIERMINENFDELEETLNKKLRKLLIEYGITEDEDLKCITYARELFFRG